MKFSKEKLADLEPKKIQYELIDDETKNLGIRIYPTGRKVFFVRYQFNNKLSRITLGAFGEAKQGKWSLRMAKAQMAKVTIELEQGRDPANILDKKAPNNNMGQLTKSSTMAVLAAHYLKYHAVGKSDRGKEDEGKLNKYILPRWGHIRIDSIKRKDITQLHEHISTTLGFKTQANRVRSLLQHMFTYAIKHDVVEHNPVQYSAKNKPKAKTRFLNEHEIKHVWFILDKTTLSQKMRLCLRLLLITGQRITEVLEMKTSDVDMKNKQWIVWKGRDENKKAGHLVPLTDLAIHYIKEAIAFSSNSEFIFESDTTPGQAIKENSVNRALNRKTNTILQIGEKWTPHDLRRTVYTHMIILKIPKDTLAYVFNHISEQGRQVSKVYNQHDFINEKRHALEKWSDYLQDLTGNPPEPTTIGQGKVIDFKARLNNRK